MMVKTTLNNLMKETSLNEVSEKGTLTLLLAVLMKYGIAPLVIFYFAWANIHKDDQNQKNTEKLVLLIEKQTEATVKNTEVSSQLVRVVEKNTQKLEDIERKK